MNDEVQVCLITDDYMKSNYVKTLEYEFFENIIYFLCAYPIISIVNHMINKNDNMLYLNCLSIIPIFLMTYLRVKIKIMKKFILGIILVMSISVMIIGLVLKQYIFVVVLIIFAFICIKKSTSKQRVEFNKFKLLAVEALLIPQILIAAGANLKEVQVFTSIISIVIMLISIGYICKARNVRLSMDDAKNESFNKKDNNIFIAGIIALITIIIFMLFMIGTFDTAYDLTKKIASSLTNMVNGTGAKPITDITTVNTHKNDSNGLKMLFKQAGEPSKLSQMILRITNVILEIIFIVIVIIVSYLGINRLLIYIKNLKNKDKVTFVFNSNNENEIKKKVEKIRYNINKILFFNDRERIRKLYKDKILKYKKNNIKVNNFFSTNEIQKEILNKVFDNIEDITKIYEKARYSNEEITKEDMETVKCKKKSS